MKTPRRTVSIIVALAVGSCALLWTICVFAQSTSGTTTVTLNITGEPAKLKAAYQSYDAFDRVLQAHGSKYSMKHDGKDHKKGTISNQRVTASEIIKVQTSTDPTAPVSSKITGPNVTQLVATTSMSDMSAILAAFE